jgi:broad specificity phosphatase PhoE
MRIGLIRHFQVKKPLPRGWMTVAELLRWREEYEASEVIPGALDLGGIQWNHCWSSDLPRAWATAQCAFKGEILSCPQLREADLLPFQTGNLRMPVWCWQWLLRLAWATAHKSQRPIRNDVLQRVWQMAERLCAQEEDTLVVGHAGIMHFLHKELLRRGFAGPRFTLADHGRLYLYTRSSLPHCPAATSGQAVGNSANLRSP